MLPTKKELRDLGLYSITIEPAFNSKDEFIYIHARQISHLSDGTHKIEAATIEDGFTQLIQKGKLFVALSNIGRLATNQGSNHES